MPGTFRANSDNQGFSTMSGWKKLDVKDLNLDIEAPDAPPDKGSKEPTAVATYEEVYDIKGLDQPASSRSNLDSLEIWAAYRKFRDTSSKVPGEKVPVWILEFFDTVAGELASTRTNVDVREFCRSALNISKKDLARYRKSEKSGSGEKIAKRVAGLRDEKSKKKKRARVKMAKIFAEVASEFSCSEAKVRNAYERFCRNSESPDSSLENGSNKDKKVSTGKKPGKEKSKRQKK